MPLVAGFEVDADWLEHLRPGRESHEFRASPSILGFGKSTYQVQISLQHVMDLFFSHSLGFTAQECCSALCDLIRKTTVQGACPLASKTGAGEHGGVRRASQIQLPFPPPGFLLPHQLRAKWPNLHKTLRPWPHSNSNCAGNLRPSRSTSTKHNAFSIHHSL